MVFGPNSPEFAMMLHRYRNYPQLLDMFEVSPSSSSSSNVKWDARAVSITTLKKMISEMENCDARVVQKLVADSGTKKRKRKHL